TVSTVVGGGTISKANLAVAMSNQNKTYDGTTAAALAAGAITATGVTVGGVAETATVNKASGTYNSKNVNAATTVTATLVATDFAAGTADLSNYNLPTTVSTVVGGGTISKANLAVAMSNQNKTYDGTTAAALATGAITATGVTVGGVAETATVNKASGTYNSKNVNAATTVTATLVATDFAAGTADLSNYNLPTTVSTVVGGGTISKANLAVAMSNQNKTYDGTTAAALATGAITATGVTVGGVAETATVNKASGTYNSKNVNAATTVTATLVATDFAAGTADLSNYNLPTTVSTVVGGGTISKANLAVAMSNQNKTYDGTTAAALATGAITATGVTVGGVAETATVNKASGTYNSKNVNAATTVTATLVATDFAAGTADLSNYNLPTTVSTVVGGGTISKANLAVAMSNQNKTYDGTTAAALATGAITATGVTVGGVAETATVNKASGTYNSKNVNAATTVTATLVATDFAAGTADLSNYNLPTTVSTVVGGGTISKANLAVAMSNQNKTYDGTTAAAWQRVRSQPRA
ncbi:YDG domain-containing protein, partial [Limnohabitans planktonicus]